MAKINASCRKCRREGKKLFLKGEKCFSPKCPFLKRGYPPGSYGISVRGRISEYGRQLREKQKARRIYGISEKQFKNYFLKAQKKTNEGSLNFLILLERRLDNVVYRLGFAPSRKEGRQLVSHGHFLVNKKKLNIPSYQVKQGDEIEVKEKSKNLEYFKNLTSKLKDYSPPSWLKLNIKQLKAKVSSWPKREEIGVDIDESLITEFYSR